MENPRGRIVSVHAVNSDAYAIVKIDAIAACSRCAAGKGCGAGLLGGDAASRHVEAMIASGMDVQQGDEVIISLEPRNLLQAALLVYGMPLAGAVLAALVAYGLGLGDRAAAVTALVGIAAGFMLARLRLQNDRCLRQFVPTVTGRAPATLASNHG
jgi:sigma-E factor negative regulatory protein RseC